MRRCLVDARRHGVPASLVVFSVSNAARASELLPRVLEERRGSTRPAWRSTPDGGLRLFVLLPLTDGKGAEAYLKRLDKAVQTKLRVSLDERGVRSCSRSTCRTPPAIPLSPSSSCWPNPRRRGRWPGDEVAYSSVSSCWPRPWSSWRRSILGVGATQVPNAAVGLYLLGAAGGAAALLFAVTPQGRRPRVADALLVLGFAVFFPVFGLPGLGAMLAVRARSPGERRRTGLRETDAAQPAGQPADTDLERRFGPGLARGDPAPQPRPETRLRVVLACRSLPERAAVQLLRLALRDPVDDVRLLAYAVLERKEREIQTQIQELLGGRGRRRRADRSAPPGHPRQPGRALLGAGLPGAGRGRAAGLLARSGAVAHGRGPPGQRAAIPRMAFLAGRALCCSAGPTTPGPCWTRPSAAACPSRWWAPTWPRPNTWSGGPHEVRRQVAVVRQVGAAASRAGKSIVERMGILTQPPKANPHNLPRLAPGQGADIGLLLEGTYPFVSGGVSSWVHEIISGPARADLRGGVHRLGARRLLADPLPAAAQPGARRDPLPGRAAGRRAGMGSGRQARPQSFEQLARLHDELRDRGGEHLATPCARRWRRSRPPTASAGATFSYSEETWHQICASLPQASAPRPRSSTTSGPCAPCTGRCSRWPRSPRGCRPSRCCTRCRPDTPGFWARCCSTAGSCPFILTEHGIYTKERKIDLAHADWIKDAREELRSGLEEDRTYVRRLWVRFFESIGRLAYAAADPIIALYEGNRARQIDDGAARGPHPGDPQRHRPGRFTGRRRAPGRGRCPRARPDRPGGAHQGHPRLHPGDARRWWRRCPTPRAGSSGPEDEDPEYARECHELVRAWGWRAG